MTRKRRRLLIATMLAVLLIGGRWLTRSRVDQRFVGNWRPPNSQPWDLKGDGTASILGEEYFWSSEGDILTLRRSRIGRLLPDVVSLRGVRVFGVSVDPEVTNLTVLSIDQDRIEIVQGDGTVEEWQRVPD